MDPLGAGVDAFGAAVVAGQGEAGQGLPPLTDGLPDFFVFVEDDTDNAAGLNADEVARRIPRKFGLDPRRDVRVLALMHRCSTGRPTALAAFRLLTEGSRGQI
ncbi:hypothetical protein [Streptomyces sp. NBC_01451]|uniref:hypothetical protein n=1 Tax=Streptomyces sp. NBC_01451 TaxID=2903872 RepID=UPI002E3371CE|nr:hypothetical protein [Streptomyces sp. NBC_01451]